MDRGEGNMSFVFGGWLWKVKKGVNQSINQSINQSTILKFITRYFQVLSVSPVMDRKRGWDSGVSPSAGGRGASSGAT